MNSIPPRRRIGTSSPRSVSTVDRNTELDLIRRWQDDGDEEALARLVISFQPLAKSLARKFGKYRHPFNELVQEANVGMVQAASKFDADRGVRFATYAHYWIRARIFEFVCANHSVVRVFKSSGAKHAFFSLERLRRAVDGPLPGPPSSMARKVISEVCHINPNDVEGFESAIAGVDASLHAPLSREEHGGGTFLDSLPDPKPNPEENLQETSDWKTKLRWLARHMLDLSVEEQIVLRERWLSEEKATLKMIGARIGRSAEGVRQLELRAIRKLRDVAQESNALPTPRQTDGAPIERSQMEAAMVIKDVK